jgi:DNA (cytosine-5)-methyltransferase 1
MTFLDLFAGIGGFRAGMEAAGHQCVGYCERDIYAFKSYRAIYNTDKEWFNYDITKVKAEDLPNADCWCAGFPCQPFSVAGKRQGFRDPTRGGLFGEIVRLLRSKKPSYLFFENVRGLLSKRRDYGRIITALDECGYDLQWQVINSKYFVPQNRERVYIIGHLRGLTRPEIFPLTTNGTEDSKLQEENGEPIAATITANYSHTNRSGNYIAQSPSRVTNLNKGARQGERFYSDRGIAPTLLSNGGGGVLPPYIVSRARGYNQGGLHSIAPALSANAYQENNALLDGAAIRRLTPLECWRLQGFSDEAFHKAKSAGISDNQLYKQAGNSVTIPVIEAIANKFPKGEPNGTDED